jgi:hypothetical protein
VDLYFSKLRDLVKQLLHRKHNNHLDKHPLLAGIMREYLLPHKQGAFLVQQEQREQQEGLVLLDLQEVQVLLEKQVCLEKRVPVEAQEQQEQLVHKDQLAQRGVLEQLVTLVVKALLV